MVSLVTIDDCRKILYKHYNEEFDGKFEYCLKPSADFEKHMLLTMKILQDNTTNRHQFFVKKFSSKNKTSSPLVNHSKKEVNFYKFINEASIVSGVELNCVPKLYHASATRNTLVLEDLSKLGYKQVSGKLDEKCIEVALQTLSRFHSLSLVYENMQSKALDKSFETTGIFTDSFFGNITPENIDSLVTVFSTILKDNSEELKENIRKEYNKLIRKFTTDNNYKKVCCHGDLMQNNILFKTENSLPISAKIVGFKMARYAPPAHDVTLLLYSCMSKNLRKEKYQHFLKYYYASLEEELKKFNLEIEDVLPMYQFEETCNEYMRFAKLIYALRKLKQSNNFTGDIISDLRYVFNISTISEEDIHAVLQNDLKTTHYELLDYKLTPMEVKSGFLGEHIHLEVFIVANNTKTTLKYFVKALPELESQRTFAIDTGGIFKETQMFRRLLPDLWKYDVNVMNDCVPKCYLVRPNDVFIFEDLKEKGYEIISVRKSFDLNTALLSIRSLAKYHAAPLILEEIRSQELGTKYRLAENYSDELKETFYSELQQCKDLLTSAQKGLGYYMTLSPEVEDSSVTKKEIQEIVSHKIGQFPSDVQPSEIFRNTICHGDLWPGNLMFLMEDNIPKDCLIIDFQSYRSSPPAQDLLAMIYLCTDRELRTAHMKTMLNYYYQQLTELFEESGLELESVISKEEYWASVEHYEEFAIVQACTHLQIVALSADLMGVLMADGDYCKHSFFVDRSEHLENCCRQDEVYRKIQCRTMVDLREMCEKMMRKD